MEYYHPCLQNKSKVTFGFANKMVYASVPSNYFIQSESCSPNSISCMSDGDSLINNCLLLTFRLW